MRKLTFILCMVLLLVLLVGAVVVYRWVQEVPPEAAAAAELRAAQLDAGGVDPSSSFILDFPQPISAASVRRCLRVEPEISIGLHQGGSKEQVLIAPAQPLPAGETYVFTLSSGETSYSWAFQVKEDFAVSDFSPASQSQAALDQPLTFTLDQPVAIDPARLEEYFSLTPATPGGFSQEGRTLYFHPDQGWQADTVYRAELKSGLPARDSSVVLAESCRFSFETESAADGLAWQVRGEQVLVSGERAIFRVDLTEAAALESALRTWDQAAGEAQRSLAQDEVDRLLTLQAQLYRFNTGEDYAALLAEVIETKPVWSQAGQNLSGCSLAGAELRSTMSLRLRQQGSDYILEWPTAPPEGCYLLRLTYQGSQRDLLFCVSDLDAWLYANAAEALLWLHHSASGAAVSANITDLLHGGQYQSDQRGLARLEHQGSAVYLIDSEAGQLVLPLAEAPSSPEQNDANWRYLYIDQAAYQSGDRLRFWGAVQPRDGSPLEYERVSVFIRDEAGEERYFDYAPLEQGLFSGEISLPSLLPGAYRLEIWQSGRELVSRGFSLGRADDGESFGGAPAEGLTLELAQEGTYQLGDSFAVAFHQGEGEYLFLELGRNIREVSYGENSLYLGSFAPENYLNCYMQAVYYHQGYVASQPTLLALDGSGQRLNIHWQGPNRLEAGEKALFRLQVTDNAGQPVAGAGVMVAVVSGSQEPPVDCWREIYEDYLPARGSREPAPAYDGQCLFFAAYSSDEEGMVSGELAAAGGEEPCYLVVQALSALDQLQAAALVQPLLVAGYEPEAPRLEMILDSAFYQGEAAFIGGGYQDLVLAAGAERVRLWSLLAEAAACAEADPLCVAAAERAKNLLSSEGGELTASLLADVATPQIAQEPEGSLSGLAADSCRAALVAQGVLDASALGAYLDLRSAAGQGEAAALGARAALGEQVLNQLLAAPTDNVEDELWLLLGRLLSGDSRPAGAELARVDQARLTTASAWSLYGVVLAAAGQYQPALDALDQARRLAAGPHDYVAEQVALAHLLLPHCQSMGAGLSYRIDGTDYRAEAQENAAFLLPLNSFTGRFELTGLGEGLAWLRLSGTRAGKSNGDSEL